MSQPAQVPQVGPAPANHVNTALVRGKLAGKPRRYSDRDGVVWFAHLVRLPAADEYSSAQTIEVHAEGQPLGQPDDPWQGRVKLGGAARSFTYTDAQGDKAKGIDCRIRLSVV